MTFRAQRQPMRRRHMLLATAALSLTALGSTAWAQTANKADATDVGEVVVTARKVEERLRDVPLAASVIDATAIEQRGMIMDTGGIVQATPGARFNDLSVSLLSEVSIRSAGTARGTNADTGVGLYANGVYVQGGLQFGRNFTRIDFFDMGRAEVLRGTLGALYGRNAVGGAVNLISAQPAFDRSGKVQAEHFPDLRRTVVQGVVNEALTDTIAVRVGMEYIQGNGGMFYNTSLREYFDEQQGFIGRVQVRYRGEKLDVTALYQNQQMVLPSFGFHLDIAPGVGCPATWPANPSCPNGYSRGYFQDTHAYPHNTHTYVHQDVSQGTLLATYDLDFASITSTTSHRRRFSRFNGDLDGQDPGSIALNKANGNIPVANPNVFAGQNLDDRTYTYYQDLHIAGTKTDAWSWLAGFEFVRTDSDYSPEQYSDFRTQVGGGSAQSLHYMSYAYYGSVGYDVTDTLNLSGELRYTQDEKGYYTRGFLTPARVLGAVAQRTFSGDNVSYNAVATWKFMPQWMAYAKVGSGYRAGGFNSGQNPLPPNVPTLLVTPTYDNEVSQTFEAGAKGNLLSNLYVTVAAYQTNTDDVLTQTTNGCFAGNPTCNVAGVNFVVNAGEAKLWGIELEAALRFALLDGTANVRATTSRQEAEFQSGIYAGKEIPQSPDWVHSLNFDYRRPVFGLPSFVNVNYRGQRGGVQEVLATAAAPPPLQDWDIVDVRAGFIWRRLEVSANFTNVFDEVYTLFDAATNDRWSAHRSSSIMLRYRW